MPFFPGGGNSYGGVGIQQHVVWKNNSWPLAREFNSGKCGVQPEARPAIYSQVPSSIPAGAIYFFFFALLLIASGDICFFCFFPLFSYYFCFLFCFLSLPVNFHFYYFSFFPTKIRRGRVLAMLENLRRRDRWLSMIIYGSYAQQHYRSGRPRLRNIFFTGVLEDGVAKK